MYCTQLKNNCKTNQIKGNRKINMEISIGRFVNLKIFSARVNYEINIFFLEDGRSLDTFYYTRINSQYGGIVQQHRWFSIQRLKDDDVSPLLFPSHNKRRNAFSNLVSTFSAFVNELSFHKAVL